MFGYRHTQDARGHARDMDRAALTKRVLIAFAAVTALVVTLLVVDRLLSRNDRIRHVRRVSDLMSVRDEILRYEHEHGDLPRHLGELVPRYLRQDQVAADGRWKYVYDPRERTVALAEPTSVIGLVVRTAAARTMRLPPKAPVIASTDTPAAAQPVDAGQAAPGEPEPETETETETDPTPPPPPGPPRLEAALVVPAGGESSPAPSGAYVFEAEQYSETNYGWEVHRDASSSGGAYIHSKEGMANGPGQIYGGIADFYNIEEKAEYTYLKYHFRLPESGSYFIYARFWTTGSHCSNCVIVGLDEGGPLSERPGMGVDGYHGHAMINTTPFRWVWTPGAPGARTIEKGDHYLHLYLHEDGERLDQIAISPVPLQGDQAYAANMRANEGTAFQHHAPSPVHLMFDVESMVMTEATRPAVSLSIRRIRAAEGEALLSVVLEGAGAEGEDLPVDRGRPTSRPCPNSRSFRLISPSSTSRRCRGGSSSCARRSNWAERRSPRHTCRSCIR